MKVLIVDDDSEQRSHLKKVVVSWGYRAEMVEDGAAAIDIVPEFSPNVILTDLMMPGIGGLELIARLRSQGLLPPTIVLTAFGSVEMAVETVHKHGAFWFLEKPVDTGALRALLPRAAEQGRLASENERLRMELTQRGVLGDLVGRSPAMQAVFLMIRQVAPTSANVLITGESGTGKELTARAIHSFSPRSTEPFLALNCAAMPETLIESEIFGHEKGAFTGAVERRAGALELAQGGTLFLDEIGEMPMPMQAKLLRVLEDFRYRRLGGKQEMKADVRLLAATNRVPEQAIREGKLREDLYYRLNVFQLELPPLRKRVEDIPLIATAMIEKLNLKHSTRVTHLDAEAVDALCASEWNGNVRELRNAIERAVILTGEGPLLKLHLNLGKPAHAKPLTGDSSGGLGIDVGMTISDGERVLIQATLRNMKNNKTQAAKALGISAKTLHAKIKQYRIFEEESSTEAAAV